MIKSLLIRKLLESLSHYITITTEVHMAPHITKPHIPTLVSFSSHDRLLLLNSTGYSLLDLPDYSLSALAGYSILDLIINQAFSFRCYQLLLLLSGWLLWLATLSWTWQGHSSNTGLASWSPHWQRMPHWRSGWWWGHPSPGWRWRCVL